MRLKLSLTRVTGTVRDIVVTADSTATVGEVARAVAERDPEGAAALGTAPPTLRVTAHGSATQLQLPAETPLSEAKVASGASVAVVSSHAAAAAQRPVAALLRVIEGPDAGREFQLRRGSPVSIGRDPSADLVLTDPLISKRHARVEVDRTVDFVDLNSANGLVVGGVQVTRAGLASGDVIMLGDSVIRADIVEPLAEEAVREPSGPIAFTRSPRVEPRYPGTEYEGPEIPKPMEPIPFPWVALAAPAVMGIVFLFLPNVGPLRFVFILLAPIIMIGTFVNQVISQRRKHRAAVKRFEEQLAFLSETLDEQRERERTVRLLEAPSTFDVLESARALGPLLWTRRPEHWSFLNVRLGMGAAPSRNTVQNSNTRNGIPEYITRFEELVERHRLIDDVPFVDSLAEAGAIGVAGDVVEATEVAQSVMLQLAGLYSPAELTFSAIVSPAYSRQFEWLKWLPHTSTPYTPLPSVQLADSAVAGDAVLLALEELIDSRTADRGGPRDNHLGPLETTETVMRRGAKVGEEALEVQDDEAPALPAIVVLVSRDAPVDQARLVTMAERAGDAGIYTVWIGQSVADLPAVCRTYIDVRAEGESIVGMVRAGEELRGTVDRVGFAHALDVARGLAAVTDAGSYVPDASDLPDSVAMAQLLGPEILDASDAIVDRWTQNDSLHDRSGAAPRERRAGRLRAIVGQSSLDAMHLDLRAQGPHALVGGTTGSGKSEFLQTWVLSMAAEYSPDRVTFLLVDYKGGTAFADCGQLPHCVAPVITDLTPALVRRALTSLRAEIRHREELINRKQVKDIIELEKSGDPECPPALVLVIDEFAALVAEVPEFVDGVVDIAARGRSLGIHLIMATQRPAGVIRDNLRANTNLRVALRMADPHESIDVVGTPVAASFDPDVAGRGVVRTGPGRVQSFQAGYAGGWTTAEPPKPVIELADLGFGIEVGWADPPGTAEPTAKELGPTDTARLVATIKRAARDARVPAPRKPWLELLAGHYDLSKLQQRTDAELLIGVTDDPDKQSQYPVYFRPDTDANLAIYGTGGSGKSTALRTLAIASAIAPRGGPVHVYGIDFSSGGLRPLERLPHVGSIIAGDDTERILRLMRHLRATIDERTDRYAAAEANTIAEYRSNASRPDEPRILLLVDGMATFRQEYEFSGSSNVFAMFQQILSDGRSAGVHAIVTADRPASISPTIAASIQRRVALRLSDDNDYQLLDSPIDVITGSSPRGRGIVDGLETQVAVFGGSSNLGVQTRAIAKLAETLEQQGVLPAPPIEKLAERIQLADLPADADGGAVIGVADDTLGPIAIETSGAFVLAGPPASGRSTALRTLVEAVHRAEPTMKLAYLGNDRSTLWGAPEWAASAAGAEDIIALAKELLVDVSTPAGPKHRVGIVIESVADFIAPPVDQALMALLKEAKRNGHLVIAEGETSSLVPSYPLLMEVKSARRGFALQPDPQEGESIFRTGFPRAKRSEFPPGRGWLVQGGKVRRVQLGLPA